MTIRDDIRGHFARQEARFPTPAGLRDSVSAEAARDGGVERRTLNWAAVVAVGLAVAIVAGLLAAGSLRHSFAFPVFPGPSPKPTVPATVGNANLIEIDAVDASDAFALLDTLTQPSNQPQFWFSKTTDGGAHWSALTKVGPALAVGEGDSGHHIHFVDRSNGFVYGNSTAFVTHDGGRTWRDSGLHFLEMVAAAGRGASTWVVTYPCAKGTTPACPFKVYLSIDAGRTWVRSWDLPGGITPRQIVSFGDGGLLIAGFGPADMYMTNDEGLHWTTIPGRCSAGSGIAYVATPDGHELWEACGAPTSLFVSEDGGAKWVKRTLPDAGPLQQLVSPTFGIAFLLTAKNPMQLTQDGGKTWKQIEPSSVFAEIVFTSLADAWAILVDGSVWATHDGGQTWARAGRP